MTANAYIVGVWSVQSSRIIDVLMLAYTAEDAAYQAMVGRSDKHYVLQYVRPAQSATDAASRQQPPSD